MIRKAIVRGVQEGGFGYVAGTVPELGTDGRYLVPLAKVRIATGVAEDEIDLESGFIMAPQAVPRPAPVEVPGLTLTPPSTGPTTGGALSGAPGQTAPPFPAPGAPEQKVVEISFSADRNQLFAAWNAVANLADLAGKVFVSVRAESEKGLDRGNLQNGVIEPLKAADLIG